METRSRVIEAEDELSMSLTSLMSMGTLIDAAYEAQPPEVREDPSCMPALSELTTMNVRRIEHALDLLRGICEFGAERQG